MCRKITTIPSQKCLYDICQHAANKLFVIATGFFLIAAYHIFIGLCLDISFSESIRSALMQLFGILIPGLALFSLLYKKEQTLLGSLFISYLLGYASNIISYFLLVPFGLKNFTPWFVAVLAAISIIVIFGQRKDIARIRDKKDFIYWFGFGACLLINIVVYSGVNVSPTITQSTWIPTDLLFWIENSAALAGGFPVTNPRVFIDETLFYHHFSSIQIAFSNLATGIDCFTLSVPLYAFVKSFVLYGALYAFISGLTQNHWLRLFGFFVFLFGSALEDVSVTTYICHIWTHPFGFDIGFAFGLFFLHCFYHQAAQTQFDLRTFVLSLIAVGICTGAKTPTAVVVIAAAGIVCFCWLFLKKFKLAFGYGIGILSVFILIAVFCVGLGISSGESKMGGFSLWATLRDDTPFLNQVYGLFSGFVPEIVKLVVLFLVYFLCAGPLTFGLFFVCAPFVAAEKNLRTAQNVGLLFAALLGMCLGIFNIQPGHSQMYFTLSSVIPCVTVGIRCLDQQRIDWSKGKTIAVSLILSICLLFQITCGLFQSWTYFGKGLLPSVNHGIVNLFNQDNAQQDFRIEGLQASDLEALAWVRDNTPKDSLVLTDRSVISNQPGYMFYGAFSERQMYLEGDIYSRETYVPERNRLRQIIWGVYQNSSDCLQTAIDDGVDYIIQTIWLTPGFYADQDKLELVFSSETINVYAVKK